MCSVTVNVNHATEVLPSMPNLHQIKRPSAVPKKARGPAPVASIADGAAAGAPSRGTLRHSLCITCEIRWLDGIIARLVRRVGRKAAIQTLRALAPKSK